MSKTIVILAVPQVQLLDVSGPLDVFAEANLQAGYTAYHLQVVGETLAPIVSSSGVKLVPDLAITQWREQAIDTLLIAGAPGIADGESETRTLDWLRRVVPRARRYGSVCSGAFLLAEAGLLDGRQITTHWAVADQLSRRYPQVSVDKDAIYVRDGRLQTAAGVTSGLDLALMMVEDDLGREIAQRVAAQLVMFFRRPGGQMQFSYREQATLAGRSMLQEVQRWAIDNIGLPHNVASLAERAGVTPRHFSRLFSNEVGTSPAKWLEEARIAEARRLLEQGVLAPKQVAAHCGFSSTELMRRAFIRRLGVTPADYRKMFLSKQLRRKG